jgi:hypothetical protein
MSTKQHYQIAIVGSSGKGKTDAARNLNRETTAFINVENKPLPFKGDFKFHSRPSSAAQVREAMIAAGQNKEITVIVIDSFSAVIDLILIEARAKYKGFDIWNFYNDEIAKFLTLVKQLPKDVFMTAHYEILGIEGAMEKRIKVKGREIEGMVEKDFTIVLYADSKSTDKGPSYFFETYKEGTSAKSPRELFPTTKIDNDYAMIVKALDEFRK